MEFKKKYSRIIDLARNVSQEFDTKFTDCLEKCPEQYEQICSKNRNYQDDTCSLKISLPTRELEKIINENEFNFSFKSGNNFVQIKVASVNRENLKRLDEISDNLCYYHGREITCLEFELMSFMRECRVEDGFRTEYVLTLCRENNKYFLDLTRHICLLERQDNYDVQRLYHEKVDIQNLFDLGMNV